MGLRTDGPIHLGLRTRLNRMKLLIVKISSLGDVVHTFAFVNQLKKEREDISIDWLVSDAYAELVRELKGVGKVWLFRRASWGKNWWSPSTAAEIASLVSNIRKENYDLCLDLQGLLRSGLLTFLSGAKQTAGLSTAREGSKYLYGSLIDPCPCPHAVDILLNALKFFGAAVPEEPDFSFTVPEDKAETVRKSLAESGVNGRYIVFHAAARWKTKMWPAGHWKKLADMVGRESGLPILFTGSSEERVFVESIAGTGQGMHNLAGRYTLPELAALLKNAALMATLDSGPMHIAAALSTPVVALFGPTSPKKTGPRSASLAETVQKEMDCAPCFSRKCISPSGPENGCMTEIKPEKIGQLILKAL